MRNILQLYLQLVGLVLIGFFLGRKLPNTVPTRLGQFLFWVGVPISIVTFLRLADLSGAVWIAPVIAYMAILIGGLFAWVGIKWQATSNTPPSKPTQGSFILASMFGNTGFLGFPITLTIFGSQYFAWALFYDLLGSLIGAYGLGVMLGARFGGGDRPTRQIFSAILINPALWSFCFGLLFRQVALPQVAEFWLQKFAWSTVAFSLILIGMRLSKLNSWHNLPRAGISVAIKMLLVPLILGSTLPLLGITGASAQVILLQMAMPPAFSTIIIAETFNLDRNLTVTTIAIGSALLLITIPMWLWLF